MIVKTFIIKHQNGVTETLPRISFEDIVNSYHQGDLYLTRCCSELGVQTFETPIGKHLSETCQNHLLVMIFGKLMMRSSIDYKSLNVSFTKSDQTGKGSLIVHVLETSKTIYSPCYYSPPLSEPCTTINVNSNF